MISPRRRWTAAALIVGLGWLATPQAVPIYDGIGQPDEPYRYVLPPSGAKKTAAATEATAHTAVKAGLSTSGLSVNTLEVGPQFAMFLPLGALAAKGPMVNVTAEPVAPTDQPPGATIDGNVYVVKLTASGGAVTFTPKAALAVIYLRATTADQPGPVMFRRDAVGQPWQPLPTSRGGADVYVSAMNAAGSYALAFSPSSKAGAAGTPLLPLVLIGGLVLLVVVVVVVRLRVREA